MKELKKTTTTTIRWWREDHSEISDNHIDDLMFHAHRRVHRMTEQGFTSGELIYEVDKRHEGESHYRGWWKIILDKTSCYDDVDSVIEQDS